MPESNPSYGRHALLNTLDAEICRLTPRLLAHVLPRNILMRIPTGELKAKSLADLKSRISQTLELNDETLNALIEQWEQETRVCKYNGKTVTLSNGQIIALQRNIFRRDNPELTAACNITQRMVYALPQIFSQAEKHQVDTKMGCFSILPAC